MRKIWVVTAFILSTMFPALAQEPALPPGALVFSCGPQEEVEAVALARLSAAVSSPDERQTHLNAARAAIDKVAELRRDAMAGKAVGAPYQGASRYAALSAGSHSSELAELYRRAAEDNFTRSHLSASTQRINWAAGLSDGAAAYAYHIIASEGCGVDEENIQWLKAQVSRSGWFTISKYGANADMAAWLLVQHADRDVAFQADVLNLLEPLVAGGETDPRSYAYLYDRVAVNSGRPQRYGTQGRCTEAGVWEPRDLELPEQLDERRAAVGLEPEATYRARFTCPNAP